jgi:hypothetical protein
MEVHDDGSFTLTPKDGESFADTMKRAAQAGQGVSQQQVDSQTTKGISEAPHVMAAALGIGAGGAAALAAPSAIPTLATGFGKAASSSYVGKILGAKTMGEAVIKAQLYEAGFKKLLHMAFGRDRL